MRAARKGKFIHSCVNLQREDDIMGHMNKKGFTLVELLIVIGILAVLATAVVVVLNPAELLKQARDSQRVSDLASINSALALYVASTSSPTFGSTQYTSLASTATSTCESATPAGKNAFTTDGNGWVTVDLDELTGGSPLSALPRDPTNDSTYHYCYAPDDTNDTWELIAKLESTKFATTEDLDGKDGGDNASWYEVGTDPGLNLF